MIFEEVRGDSGKTETFAFINAGISCGRQCLHASHTSIAASSVITKGKIGLYSGMVKHKIVPKPTVHVMISAP